jgi:hypothetical protein
MCLGKLAVLLLGDSYGGTISGIEVLLHCACAVTLIEIGFEYVTGDYNDGD